MLQVSFEARHPERKGSKRISSDSGRGVELPKVGELSEEGSSDGDAGKDSVRRGHEPHGVGPEEGGGAEGEEAAHLCGGPGEGEAPDPEGGERHDELPDADGEEEGEEQEQPGHELVGDAEHELGEGQPGGSVCGVDGGDGDGALAHLKGERHWIGSSIDSIPSQAMLEVNRRSRRSSITRRLKPPQSRKRFQG